ncbi:MAG: amino acid permease [Bryobacteraceae bacterium]
MSAPNSPGLVRGLGLAGAIAVNVSNTIGTGVFIKARIMTCNVDSPLLVLAAWFGAGLLVLAGALTFSELAAMLPRAGGEYVFLREAYGPRIAFLQGWTQVLISRVGAHAAQAVAAAIFFNIVTGGALDGPGLGGLSRIQLASLVTMALVTLVNCAPVKTTGKVAGVLTAIKVIVVGGTGILAFVFADGNWAHYAMSGAAGKCEGVDAAARGGLVGFGAAMMGALWGYQGWANLAPMVGEVRDPARNIPRAFFFATLIVGSVYVFANASYFYALTPQEVASAPLSSSVATVMLTRIFGAATVSAMAAAMLTSSVGAIHTGFAATMRISYAMAADGLLPGALAKLSAKGVPVGSALFLGVWIGLLSLSGSYDKLTDYAIFALWLFYGLTASAVFVLRRRMPKAERPYRVVGYPVVPGLFVGLSWLLVLNTLWTQPRSALMGLGLMGLGLVFYAWRQRTSKSVGAG